MKNRIFLLIISTLLISSSCGKRDPEEIELKLNLEKGKKYEMKMTMESTIESNIVGKTSSSVYKMDLTLKLEVMDKLPNGNFLIRKTYENFEMSFMGFDASSSKKKIIGEYVELEFTPQNKLIKKVLSPKLAELEKNPDGFGGLDNLVYPNKKIKVGESWESKIEANRNNVDVIMNTNSKLISVKRGVAEVQETGTFMAKNESNKSYSGSIKANYKIEVATGLKRDAVIDISTEMGANESDSPIKVKAKVTMKII